MEEFAFPERAETVLGDRMYYHDGSGGHAAFEAFYEKYFNTALYYTAKKVRSIQDAEDLVCDAFFYCYDHFSSYDESRASLGTWLYMILNSRIKNYYRDSKQYTDLDELREILPDGSNYMEQAVELEANRRMLAEGLNTLSETQRRIVILRYFQGCSTAETARQLQITEGNVRTQLSRALDKMRKYFDMRGYSME